MKKYFVSEVYSKEKTEVTKDLIVGYLMCYPDISEEQAIEEVDNATKEKATLQFDMQDGKTYEAWAEEA